MIKGSIVAIVTAMHADGSLDFDSLGKLIEWHIAEKTDAIVIVGTTGESSTVSVEEHCSLIEFAVKQAKKRIPIIAGSGANCTTEAIRLTRFAHEVGADASLQVVPYYNRPSQEGLYQHFAAVAASCADFPIILYNVPSRTGTDLSNETIVRLAAIGNIVGVKEATGNIARGVDLLRQIPASCAVYSGDDASAIALMFCGAKGNISVTANIAPRAMHDLCMAAIEGRIQDAITINNRLLPLHQKLFVEANPVPVKWALTEMGKIGSGIRLPLVSLSAQNHDVVRGALKQAGIL